MDNDLQNLVNALWHDFPEEKDGLQLLQEKRQNELQATISQLNDMFEERHKLEQRAVNREAALVKRRKEPTGNRPEARLTTEQVKGSTRQRFKGVVKGGEPSTSVDASEHDGLDAANDNEAPAAGEAVQQPDRESAERPAE